jgi:hypothetical protein
MTQELTGMKTGHLCMLEARLLTMRAEAERAMQGLQGISAEISRALLDVRAVENTLSSAGRRVDDRRELVIPMTPQARAILDNPSATVYTGTMRERVGWAE